MRYRASIDTVLFGVAYTAGQEVDVSTWNRKQMLQMLGLGLIFPVPLV